MNTKLCIISIGLTCCMFFHAKAADKTKPAPELKWLDPAEEREKKRVKEVADLKADLASAWTTLVVAVEYNGSCTGPEPSTGFQITRQGDAFTATPWVEYIRFSKSPRREHTGKARQITKHELDSLLARTLSAYEAATLFFTPKEIVGQPPENPSELKAWSERWLDTGGIIGSDEYWIEVRLTTPQGITHHRNEWGTKASASMQGLFTTFVQMTQK